MTKRLTKNSKIMVATIITSLSLFALPSYAAQDDFEILQSYIGTWKGLGDITWHGGETEAVKCKLKMTQAKQQKINYNGRCAFAGGNFSISGTMAYFEEKKQYEAVMSTSTSFSGIAIGKRKGKNLVFQLNDKNAETGDSLEIDSDIRLKDGGLEIGFTINNITSGRTIKALIPFTK